MNRTFQLLLFHSFASDSNTPQERGMADPFQTALAQFKGKAAPIAPAEKLANPAPRQATDEAATRRLVSAANEVRERRQTQGWVGRRSKEGKRVIALLFLIIDSLPHEKVWRDWMECRDSGFERSANSRTSSDSEPILIKDDVSDGERPVSDGERPVEDSMDAAAPDANGGKVEDRAPTSTQAEGYGLLTKFEVRVWIHAKYPSKVKSEWVRERLLPNSHNPKWGSIQITMAMIDLVNAALKDPDVGQLVFVSESCIPLRPLPEVGFELWRGGDKNLSWVDYKLAPTNGYDAEQKWGRMSASVPKAAITKSDQWVSLSRQHAEDISRLTNLVNLTRYMSEVVASDEMYFATALSLLGEIGTERVAPRKLTWCDWSISAKNPSLFTEFDPRGAVLATALKDGCLFGRKWAADSLTLDEWQAWKRDRLSDFFTRLAAMEPELRETALGSVDAGEPPPVVLEQPVVVDPNAVRLPKGRLDLVPRLDEALETPRGGKRPRSVNGLYPRSFTTHSTSKDDVHYRCPRHYWRCLRLRGPHIIQRCRSLKHRQVIHSAQDG